MAGMANTSVKRMARHLFKMTRDLAAKDRAEVNAKIKSYFRSNQMADPAQRAKLLKEAASKISYLKICTPDRLLHRRGGAGASTTPKHFVYTAGELKPGEGRRVEKAKYSAYTGTNLDPEAVARHIKLVRRQHFMDRH